MGGLDSEIQQRMRGQGKRAGRGPGEHLSPCLFGSEPPGQGQWCAEVRPLWMTVPAWCSRKELQEWGWGPADTVSEGWAQRSRDGRDRKLHGREYRGGFRRRGNEGEDE